MRIINQKALIYAFLLILSNVFSVGLQAQQTYSTALFGELDLVLDPNLNLFRDMSGTIGCSTTMDIELRSTGYADDFVIDNYTDPKGLCNPIDNGIQFIVRPALNKTDYEMLVKFTFKPAIDNFQFYVHGINNGHNDEFLTDFKVNGIGISQGDGLDLDGSVTPQNVELIGQEIRPIPDPDPSVIVDGCGLIKINRQGISSITFRVEREEEAGFFLSQMFFQELVPCCD